MEVPRVAFAPGWDWAELLGYVDMARQKGVYDSDSDSRVFAR